MDEKKKSGLSTAGLVLGIVGICLCFIPIINSISFILSILAIIFGIIGIVKKAGTGKAIAALILGIITLFMAYSINNSISEGLNEINNEPNTNEVANNNTNTSELTEEPKKEYNVGEEYDGSGMKIRYSSANPNFTNYSQYAAVKDGYKVISASFEFENVSDSDKLASSFDFRCYADGYDCDKFYYVDDSSFSSSLSAGKKATGTVYFEVPQSATDVVIEYETSIWTGRKITFRVI